MQDRQNLANLLIRDLAARVADGRVALDDLAAEVIDRGEALRPSRCWALWRPDTLARDAAALAPRAANPGSGLPLGGIPVSVKDLMAVRGWPTVCGSRFYGRSDGPANQDASFIRLWRDRGALFVGKTQLNEFAYGITGENPWYGDCTIPGHPDRLTGGSSSGAAASVAGGAACVGLGTDTGGSLRVPAALCGLVSFRSRDWFPDHEGVFPLARRFDTLGWLHRHLDDVAFLAEALRGEAPPPAGPDPALAFLEGPLLSECEPEVLAALVEFRDQLRQLGVRVVSADSNPWVPALELFAPLQAREAWSVHRPMLEREPNGYSDAVRGRLEWGAKIPPAELERLERASAESVTQMTEAWPAHSLIVLPAAPLSVLPAGQDHQATRPRILRLTAPASLGLWPVLTVPWKPHGVLTGIGFQIVAPRGGEWDLVAFAERLAAR